jgi:hypothetical protein
VTKASLLRLAALAALALVGAGSSTAAPEKHLIVHNGNVMCTTQWEKHVAHGDTDYGLCGLR